MPGARALATWAAVVACVWGLPVAARAYVSVPPASEIIRRILTANAATPDVVSAEALFKFRYKKPVTEPPDCEFEGVLHLEQGRQEVSIGRSSAGLTCWLVNRFLIGHLFEGTEPAQRFLSRFEFEVLGLKLVGGDMYYLLKGRARDPHTNPRGLIGWIDYERGLITEGTVEYAWGNLDTEQRYSQVGGAWVLSYQYLFAPQVGASMEVAYSNFRFASR